MTVNLDYLLEPTFQLVNTAGKPLTGGWLEVYINGTRTKYYCSSDFDGTLHPFKIPLDSLGSNIVLASPFNKYDVYVYNKFGSLVMSRYGVHTGGNFADISGEEQYFIGEGQLTVDASLGSSSYLLDNLTQIDGNLPVSSGNLELPDESLYNVEANFEFEVLNYNLINQDIEIEVEIKNPCRVTDHVNVLKGYTTINCSNVNKNTLTLCGLIYGGKDSITGTPHLEFTFKRLDSSSTPAQIRAHLTNISVYKIAGIIAGESVGGETYYAGDYINISPSNVISAVGLQPAGDYATNSDLQAVSANIPDVSDLASTTYVDNSIASSVTDIKSWVNQQGYLSNSSLTLDEDNNVTAINGYEVIGTTYTAGDFININNDIISVTGVAPASSIPETEDVSFEELDVSQFALVSAIPDVSDFVTTEELASTVSGLNVQSDWNETASASPAFIKNKPNLAVVASTGSYTDLSNKPILVVNENDLLLNNGEIRTKIRNAWNNKEIVYLYETFTNNDRRYILANVETISDIEHYWFTSTQSEYDANSQVYSNAKFSDRAIHWTYNTYTEQFTVDTTSWIMKNADWSTQDTTDTSYIKNKPDLSIYATNTDLQTVSAAIGSGGSQVNSDWDAVSGVAEILNKPTEKNIVAGSYISISEVNGNVQIAASGVQPSGNYLTSSDVTNVTYVNSLPGSPVAGTLYLIPET